MVKQLAQSYAARQIQDLNPNYLIPELAVLTTEQRITDEVSSYIFFFCPNKIKNFADTSSSLKKTSLREIILLTVNSALFNFPLDRTAIFSSAKDMTLLKVEWVTKWKICELGKSCGIIWGKLRT